jgi:hypothetical protein
MKGMSHIFFFSEQCKYSTEAYTLIKKIGINKFRYVNVLEQEHIPPDIDRVPALLTNEKQLLFEQDLFDFLYRTLDVEPFMINEMGQISDKYSYMDNTHQIIDHSYKFLDKEDHIITPTEEDNKKILNYEDYLQQRDNDLKVLSK